MVQKVLVQLVDDLDGSSSDDITTVEFALDGVSYEMDLTAANADRLRETLAPFVIAARRASGRTKPAAAASGRVTRKGGQRRKRKRGEEDAPAPVATTPAPEPEHAPAPADTVPAREREHPPVPAEPVTATAPEEQAETSKAPLAPLFSG
ncbi:hypothetical protein GCM10012275_16400 [Longimycelium tulufanense]|uniref:Lsr2 dimerization domain-containing protein n=1 Tax=Longimycelium tulufanense TaxID=907463 RepID=A0A8J3C711_9PSEU|nr:histone-like nucleoid-structuring protein Lsr2 [Longimycelium tulufanense]GGM46119.1 hypothetical protein GCM10012275_16400 [Longimycelium tulufanense]